MTPLSMQAIYYRDKLSDRWDGDRSETEVTKYQFNHFAQIALARSKENGDNMTKEQVDKYCRLLVVNNQKMKNQSN